MKKIIYGILSFAPVLAFAQTTGVTQTLGTATQLVQGIGNIVRIATPIVFGLAILAFFYGIAVYVFSAGDPGNAAKGKTIMIYGVIAIAVMASLAGLVTFLQKSFGVDPGSTLTAPSVTGLGTTATQ